MGTNKELQLKTMEYQVLKFKRLSPLAQLPKRGSQSAAGFDLVSIENIQVFPQSRALISTGWSVQIPLNHYGRVAPRSGLALRNGIDTGAGVIDSDYRGELKVILFNFSSEAFNIQIGDRIAQLIIEKIQVCNPLEVDYLDESERNQAGFGSTGLKNQSTETKQEPQSLIYEQNQTSINSQQQPLFYQQQLPQQQASQVLEQMSSQKEICSSQQYY